MFVDMGGTVSILAFIGVMLYVLVMYNKYFILLGIFFALFCIPTYLSKSRLQSAIYSSIFMLIVTLVGLLVINLEPATYDDDGKIIHTDTMLVVYNGIIPLFLTTLIIAVFVFLTSGSAFAPKDGQSSRSRHLSKVHRYR